MAAVTSALSWGVGWPPAITGTLRVSTRTVITVAKMPSESASTLPFPSPSVAESVPVEQRCEGQHWCLINGKIVDSGGGSIHSPIVVPTLEVPK
jgi:hypothetical protein